MKKVRAALIDLDGTLCVPYGYNEGRPVRSLGADAIVPDLRAAASYAKQVNEEVGAR